MNLVRFSQDMDGYMEVSKDGDWVNYSSAAGRIEELEKELAIAFKRHQACYDKGYRMGVEAAIDKTVELGAIGRDGVFAASIRELLEDKP